MDVTLTALDKELERQLDQIKHLEAELFFKRVRLAGLQSVKEGLLRELAIADKDKAKFNG